MKYYDKINKEKPNSKLVVKRIKPIISKIVTYINIKKNTKVLDVGCGSGNFTYQFVKLSNKVTALDIENFIFKDLKKNLVIGNAENMNFKNNSFDVVICANTLHHIKNYEKVIIEMKRVSKEYIVIYEPNPKSIFIKLSGLKKEERLVLKKPLSLDELNNYFKDFEVIYKSYVVNYLFSFVLPNFILNILPKPRFMSFGNEFLLIVKKKKKTKRKFNHSTICGEGNGIIIFPL